MSQNKSIVQAVKLAESINEIIGVAESNGVLQAFFRAFRGIHLDYWISLRVAVLVVIKFFECKRCGNCCRYSPPTFKEWEVKRIAQYLKVSVKELPLEAFVNVIGNEEKIYYKAQAPCPFLRNNECMIYPVRGTACRAFPFEWLMYSLVPKYCLGALDAIKKAIFFILEKKPLLIKAAKILEDDLRRLARDNKYKEEMRYQEYKPLVNKLFNIIAKFEESP